MASGQSAKQSIAGLQQATSNSSYPNDDAEASSVVLYNYYYAKKANQLGR